MKKYYQELIHKIADHYGLKHQKIQAVQELSELNCMLARSDEQIKSDSSYRDHLLEEIADSMIMIEQMMYLHGFSEDDLFDMIDKKTKRQIDRIGIKENFPF